MNEVPLKDSLSDPQKFSVLHFASTGSLFSVPQVSCHQHEGLTVAQFQKRKQISRGVCMLYTHFFSRCQLVSLDLRVTSGQRR